ncbi:unnamed protein product [Jaminaea pallidilutea]
MPARYTQSQKEIFKLYRRGLRALRQKPEESQPAFLLYLRHAFRAPAGGGGIAKRDFSAIEYMKRRADKMLEAIFEAKGVKKVGLPAGAIEWWRGEVDKSSEGRSRS